MSHSATSAHPVPGATWQARVHDASEVTARLHALWQEFGASRHAVRPLLEDQTSDAGHPIVTARAATLNLIAATRSRRDAERVLRTIASLREVYPSRATVLIADPAAKPDVQAGLDVRIDLMEQEASRGRPATVFERLTVDVSSEDERQLASIASPLLMPDLPDFLWWAIDPEERGSLFTQLVDICDRLIVDSAVTRRPTQALESLHSFASSRDHPALGDLAWARLSPWRRLTTQFFDVPATLPILDLIDEATLTYANSVHHWSGFSSALLYAGWLGSRLHWRTPGELLPVRGEPNAWRATLRAGASGQEREVTLTLRPTARPLAASTLLDVRLAAEGGKAGYFTVERLDANEISTTSSSTSASGSMVRTVFNPVPTEADLLTEELRVFSRDHVFEAALAFAADLAPAGFLGVEPR